MAGRGQRFIDAGYTTPKPLIPVGNRVMIQVVVDSLGPIGHYIFVAQKTHNVNEILCQISPGCDVVEIDGYTEGAVCSCLAAKHLICNDSLMIVNSDQFFIWNFELFKQEVLSQEIDGCVITFESDSPKYSYVKTNRDGVITETAEKSVISNKASNFHFWSKGSDYVKYAEQMIEKNIRVRGEFYNTLVINEAVKNGLKFVTFPNITAPLGTPEELSTNLHLVKF